MTNKGELRRARRAARTAGSPMVGPLALAKKQGDEASNIEVRDDSRDSSIFTETPAGYRARERWARKYDDLNGAPEGDGDR